MLARRASHIRTSHILISIIYPRLGALIVIEDPGASPSLSLAHLLTRVFCFTYKQALARGQTERVTLLISGALHPIPSHHQQPLRASARWPDIADITQHYIDNSTVTVVSACLSLLARGPTPSPLLYIIACLSSSASSLSNLVLLLHLDPSLRTAAPHRAGIYQRFRVLPVLITDARRSSSCL